jgi:hypothetical protein
VTAPNVATTRSPTEEIARLRLERDLFQSLLELGSRDDMRPFLEDALALIAEVTGARKGYIEIDRPGRANAGGGEESNEPRLWIARGLSEDELAQARRALAEICAVLLAIAVAFGRIEAREAVLWNEQPTRADRALEILAAAAERTASSVIAAACLALILLLRALDLARARSPSLRPPLRAAAPSSPRSSSPSRPTSRSTSAFSGRATISAKPSPLSSRSLPGSIPRSPAIPR